MTNEKTPYSYWFFPLAACFLLLFLFAFRQNIDFDMGYHLRTGEWILQNHSFPRKDLFTYTVNQNDYLDLHWLYQVASYGLYQISGYAGLSFAHLILILAAFGLTALRVRLTHPSPWVFTLLFLPAVIAMEIRFLSRPEIVSWVLLILTLLILDLRLSHQRNYLFLLPPIQLLWVNVEGLFILGWVAMGAVLVSSLIQNKRMDKPLLKYSLVACAATLLNPYFLKGVAFPFVLFTRLQGSNIFKQYISEFQSPWAALRAEDSLFFPSFPIFTYRIFSLVLLLVIGLTWKKRKTHELFLVAAFFFLSTAAIRNAPLFFWVALPIAAAALNDLFERRPLRKISDTLARQRALAFAAAILILLLGARVFTKAYYVSDRRIIQRGLGLDEDRFPIRAARFMADNHLDGRLLNDLSFGGWLIWKGPSPVFIDGRLEVMREDLFTQYRDSFYTGGLNLLASRHGAQFILLDPMVNSQWSAQLRTMPQWRMVYWDETSALYAKEGAAPQLQPTRWEDLLKRFGLETPPEDSLLVSLAAKKHSPLVDWTEGFFLPQDYPMPLFRLGAQAYADSRFDVARSFFLQLLQQTSGKYFEVYFNLGATYSRLGRKDLADLCFRKVLELNPDYGPARQRLGGL